MDEAGEFRVGPYIPPWHVWGTEDPERGPWKTPSEAIYAQAGREIRLLTQAPETFRKRIQRGMEKEVSVDIQHFIAHYRLLQRLSTRVPPCSQYTLLHTDIETGNIMVDYDDTTRIVAIIDWDVARIVPVWSGFPTHGLFYIGESPSQEDIDEKCALLSARADIVRDRHPNLLDIIDKNTHLDLLDTIVTLPSWFLRSDDDALEWIESLLNCWPHEDEGYAWIEAHLSQYRGDAK